ncbi:C-X-C chemokine receptor type 5 [Bienertia sinuspersici]
MVLVTHPRQSSCATVPLTFSSWSKGIRLKQNVVRLRKILRTDRSISLKHAFPLRPVPGCVRQSKGKSLQISSFKGNIHNDNAGDSSSKSTSPKSSVKISYLPEGKEENLQESPTAHDTPVSCPSESNKSVTQSQTIRALFRKWLSLLQTGAAAEAGGDILKRSPQIDHLPEEKATSSKERGEVLKVVLCYFLGLDATIMVPLLIFIPLYVAVNVKYGSQVSRELTPLWVIGPLIVALYVKLLRVIFALYVFSFKQSVKIMKNLPTYYATTRNYLAEGKLKEDIEARFWQPINNLKNMDYKELGTEKWKAFRDWMVEMYLDFVESIWPHYCRTVRFLKRANLI